MELSKNKEERAIQMERIRPLLMIAAVLVVLTIVFEVVRPGFVTNGDHLASILRTSSFLGFVCIGQTLVILEAGIDLSVVSMIVLVNCIAAQLMQADNARIFPVAVLCLGIGAGIGALNGLLIYKLKVPALVMTLSMGNVLKGVAYLVTKGSPKGNAAPALVTFASSYGSIILFAVLSAVIIIVLKKTTFGRDVYAIGSNIEAARYSGVRTQAITITTYLLSGMFAALAGLMMIGYTKMPYFTSGSGYDMDSIAAVVIGGTLITGGRGGYTGTIIGLFIYEMLASFMNTMGMPEGARRIVQAAIIIVLLLVVNLRNKKRV